VSDIITKFLQKNILHVVSVGFQALLQVAERNRARDFIMECNKQELKYQRLLLSKTSGRCL
jgi:hypothetical protein